MPRLNGLTRSCCASLWIVAALSLAALTARADTTTFAIEPQDLSGALKAFAVQSHREIFFTPELARGRKSQGVKGKLDDLKALNIILEGTGLNYSVTTSNAILVRDPSSKNESSKSTGLPASATTADAPVHVAQVDQSAAGPQIGEDRNPEKKDEGLSEIVVTGSHIRGAPDSSAVTSYERAAIDESGAATLDQFLRTVPQNFSSAETLAVNVGVHSGGLDQFGANSYYGAAANLHGLGPAATLTLINGQRVAPAGSSGAIVDLSMIPLSAVDHIEVLADGASAIYGSDAVAGIVNVILKDKFDGAESSVREGGAQGGDKEFTVSQLLGKTWSSGNVLGVFEYDDQNGLLSTQRDFAVGLGGPSSLIPESIRKSFFLTGRQDLGSDITASANGFYNDRSFNIIQFFQNEFRTGGNKQYGGDISLRKTLPKDWAVDITANASKAEQSQFTRTTDNPGANSYTNTQIASLSVVGDGSIFDAPGGAAKMAIGAEARSEKFDDSVVAELNLGNGDLKRTVSSGFLELFFPIVEDANSSAWTHRLSVTLAGRVDHYSDFGSAFDPKVTVLWSPVSSFTIHSSYGSSFIAPLLSQLAPQPAYFTLNVPDPSSPTGQTDTLFNQAQGNAELKAETARSFILGLNYNPPGAPVQLSATYFLTEFKNQIQAPPIPGGIFSIYSQLAVAAPFLTRNPSLAAVQAAFNSGPAFFGDLAGEGAAGVQAIFDAGPANIASTKQSGIDFSGNYSPQIPVGKLDLALNGTYLLKMQYQTAAGTPVTDLLNIYGQPVNLRLRAGLNWSLGRFGSSLFANFTNDYKNPFLTPTGHIASWTTTDVQMRYSFGDSTALPPLRGFTLALSILNLFDRDPPFVQIPAAFAPDGAAAYDPLNASAVGRYVSFQLTKRW